MDDGAQPAPRRVSTARSTIVTACSPYQRATARHSRPDQVGAGFRTFTAA